MQPMNPTQVFAQAALYTDGIEYRLVHLPPTDLPAAAALIVEIGSPFCALIADKDEVTVLLAQPIWERAAARFPDRRVAAPYRLITFDLPLDFGLVGFMALVTAILAQAGVSILAISAFERDHIFIPVDQFRTAWDALKSAQTG
jgi:hypothetical protein